MLCSPPIIILPRTGVLQHPDILFFIYHSPVFCLSALSDLSHLNNPISIPSMTNRNGMERTMHIVLTAENGAPVNSSAIGISTRTRHIIILNAVLGLPLSSRDFEPAMALSLIHISYKYILPEKETLCKQRVSYDICLLS